MIRINHLTDIDTIPAERLQALLGSAEQYLQTPKTCPTFPNAQMATLFYENSTRTRLSFQLASQRLNMPSLALDSHYSSVQKGESIEDTAANLVAMGINILVIRHPDSDAPQRLLDVVGKQAAIINAGSGTASHPTQALLDVLTILQHKRSLEALTIAIIGDILHSRVARSQIVLLHKLGVQSIRLIAPNALLPAEVASLPVDVYTDMTKGLQQTDVAICLRIQKERMPPSLFPDVQAYREQFGLTPEKCQLLKPDAIIMHPGPMNRGVEIDSAVADGAQSVILEQARNGVALRMAVLASAAEHLH
jgi:aspartate carbamoyltransferase catalytic subunit